MATIEINSDSNTWLQVRHALKAAGYRVHLQGNLFAPQVKSLFLEPMPEPEGGRLVANGMMVYDGGVIVTPHIIEEVRQEEINR